MKIKKTLIQLAFTTTLVFSSIIKTSFNDDFEEEFMEKMHAIEKNIQASFNKFHDRFFHDLENHTQDLENLTERLVGQSDGHNLIPNNNRLNFYQQSSSSLSFSNNEKSIKIKQQKNQETTQYIIDITENKPQTQKDDLNTTPQEKSDTLTELTTLQNYVQKTFHSKPAVTILEKCINEISHEHKNKLVNITTENNSNQKRYTIEIIEKKDNNNDLAQETEVKETSKKKKSDYKPRNKKSKQ